MIIKLNDNADELISQDGYELSATEKYEINLDEELDFQLSILGAFEIMGAPPAYKNYQSWLYKNNFNVDSPNPTNEFVSKYYGTKPLWKTDYSQGIVVRAVDDDDYYIVMECSSKNEGYKHTKIILTLGGCLD